MGFLVDDQKHLALQFCMADDAVRLNEVEKAKLDPGCGGCVYWCWLFSRLFKIRRCWLLVAAIGCGSAMPGKTAL